jgi:hypothetical protein
MTSTEASVTVLTHQQTGFLAGCLAVLVQVGDLYQRSPMLGFITMGLLGSIAGFGLLMEQGRYDEVSQSRQLRSLGLRIVIGCVIGVGVGLLWADTEQTGKGVWMLATVVIASAPIDMWRIAVDTMGNIIRRKGDK